MDMIWIGYGLELSKVEWKRCGMTVAEEKGRKIDKLQKKKMVRCQLRNGGGKDVVCGGRGMNGKEVEEREKKEILRR